MTFLIRLAPLAILTFITACTTLDNLAVGQTDRLEQAPFYKSYRTFTVQQGKVLVTPVGVDQNSREQYPAAQGDILSPLQAAFDDYIGTQQCCRPSPAALPDSGQPSVYLGSSEGEYAPPQAEDLRMEYEKYPPMVIHLDKANEQWRSMAADLLAAENAGGLLVLNLSFSQYPKADKGAFGKKVVLGTNNEQPVRFLSAEPKPVEVLQITGMLVDPNGQVVRAGAEGIIARDSPFWVQVLEAGRDIDNAAIEAVLSNERRDDLPGAPLSWQVAIDNLLWQLLK